MCAVMLICGCVELLVFYQNLFALSRAGGAKVQGIGFSHPLEEKEILSSSLF